MVATVTHLRPAVPDSHTAYRAHHVRPTNGGIDMAEWAIETQMAAAVDSDSVDPFAALNPQTDEVLVDAIERLYDLAAQAGRAEIIGDWAAAKIAAVEYQDELTSLAKSLRGVW